MATQAETIKALAARLEALEATPAQPPGEGAPGSPSTNVPSPEPPAANVIEAINRVKRDLPGIGKTDTAENVDYKFRGIETLTAHLQNLTARHGVVIMPSGADEREDFEYTTKAGTIWHETRIHYCWAVYGPGGINDVIYGENYGFSRDNADKGSSKAGTQGYKEFLLKLFCIGDKSTDPDHNDMTEGGDQATEGRVFGSGRPPGDDGQQGAPPTAPPPVIDDWLWLKLGWMDPDKVGHIDKSKPFEKWPMADRTMFEEQRKEAIRMHEAAGNDVKPFFERLPVEVRAKLVERRQNDLGKLPFSVQNMNAWKRMVEDALAEQDDAQQQELTPQPDGAPDAKIQEAADRLAELTGATPAPDEPVYGDAEPVENCEVCGHPADDCQCPLGTPDGDNLAGES